MLPRQLKNLFKGLLLVQIVGGGVGAVEVLARLLLGNENGLFGIDAQADAGNEWGIIIPLRIPGRQVGRQRDQEQREQRIGKDLGQAYAQG